MTTNIIDEAYHNDIISLNIEIDKTRHTIVFIFLYFSCLSSIKPFETTDLKRWKSFASYIYLY